MQELEHMWNERLTRIGITKLSIEHAFPIIQTISSAMYREVP